MFHRGLLVLSCYACLATLSAPTLSADSDTILIHPLKKRTLKFNRRLLKVGVRSGPVVGDEKTKARIVTAQVRSIDTHRADPEAASVRAYVSRKGKVTLYALPEAAGKEFVLEVGIRSRLWEYRREVFFLPFSDPETPPRVRHRWVEIEPRYSTDVYPLIVSLGKLPTISLGPDESTSLELPKWVSQITLANPNRSRAKIEIDEGNIVRIHGKTVGKEQFKLKYTIAGRVLRGKIRVHVRKNRDKFPLRF